MNEIRNLLGRSNIIIYRQVLLAIAFLLAGNITINTVYAAGNPEHRAPESEKGFRRTFHEIELPDVTLTDMNGTRVALGSELDDDKPLMVNFIFTSCPSICPVLSAMFSQAQNHLGPDLDTIRMVSISIDPEHDTPEELRKYAETFHAGPQWHFLTGNLDDIIAVEKAFDVFRGNKMNHEPYTFIRAVNSDSWVRIDGFIGAEDLAKEYQRVTAN
ncbi:MAG: SCO family protein [Gammaproteobacteria bacterium]|jgi:protein SCO1/2|nr:hypothetical protein [Chromatiales bacterium]MDP6673569.1 SCO family protein [Gammaproteobacteria bacterium]